LKAATSDPIIADARRRMEVAAELYDRAEAELLRAMRALEKHPDFKRTERLRKAGASSREALTLAWWIHNGLHSDLHDMMVSDVADLLRKDDEARLREFIETEERDAARFARRQGRRASAA
jgi:predicted translin family RNA/ssDNA-binding protein